MEFQAIVMAAGKGNRMTDIILNGDKATRNSDVPAMPKCLLPIGNRPMVYYPVRMLEKAGFTEINIITLNSCKSRVETELKVNCGIKASLNIVGIDDNDEEDDFGTANSLYLLKDKIVNDCMIVSCDLISNVNIQRMANFYRNNSASFTMLLSNNIEQYSELPATGEKGKYKPERDLIGMDIDTNRLLFFGAEADISDVKIKSSLIQKYPKINWTSKLQDAHFYIIKKWLVDYIIDNKRIISLKSEFLPYVIKKQFSSVHKKAPESSLKKNLPTAKKPTPKILDYHKIDELTKLINKATLSKSENELLSCYAFIQEDGFCLRTNNLTIFAESNRQIMGKIMPFFQRERTNSLTGKSSQVNLDSLIGEGSKIGDKALVKRSVIGRNCHIGEKSKITNSIIMDNVKIGEGVIIQGSIICSGSNLNEKTELKDCLVCYDQDVTTKKYSSDTIKWIDDFMQSDSD